MKKLLLLSIMIGLFFAESRKEHSFLSDIQVNDPHIQREIDIIRQQYIAESDQIRAEYQQKIDALKKQRRSEIESLQDAYKNRLKNLKNEYPDAFKKKPKARPIKREPQPNKVKTTAPVPEKKRSIK